MATSNLGFPQSGCSPVSTAPPREQGTSGPHLSLLSHLTWHLTEARRHFRPLADACTEASPNFGADCCAAADWLRAHVVENPAPPSAAPAPWSLRAGSLAERGRSSVCRGTSLPRQSLPPRAPRPDSLWLGPRAPGPARAARREDERRAAEGGAASAAAGQRGPQGVRVEQGAAERRGLGRQGAEGLARVRAREDPPRSTSFGRGAGSGWPGCRRGPGPPHAGRGSRLGTRKRRVQAELLSSSGVYSAGSRLLSATKDCARAGCGIHEVRLVCTVGRVVLLLLD